jgi:drug/metabolite transporter (DMT)-like permease
LLGLGLGLTSSLCWGVSDFIGGLSARRLPLLFVMISSQAVGLAVVIGVVAIRGTGAPDLARLLPAVGGGLAAGGFGCYFVGVQSSARADPMWALLASRVAAVALLLAVVAVRGGIAVGRPGRLWPLAVMGVLDVSATGLYAVATRHGLLSVVSVAASLYPLATVLLARVVLGERVRRVQELGIAAALAGVALMAAG